MEDFFGGLGKILGEANQCDLAAPFFLLLFSLYQMGFLLTPSSGTSCGVKYYITSVKLLQSIWLSLCKEILKAHSSRD